ncbi:DUF2157 domain-containing protein [bacterium]|nr:DUF2157 domain-containing protein [bacterium]MBU3930355.1 DUF2157 domain-containing protein [bacterium]
MIGGIIISLLMLVIAYAVIRAIVIAIFGGNRHGDWLGKQLPLWEGKKIINTEQSGMIRQFYHLDNGQQKKKTDAVKIILIIGAIFLGVGVIFLVASNWRKIPAHIRTINLLLITIAALFAGYYFSYEKEGHPLLGKSLLFLASIFWGSSIILICQIYNIPSSDNWMIMLLWALPVLPVAYFFNNKYVFLLASVLLIAWNFLYNSSNSAANYYYPVLVFCLILPMAFKLGAGVNINILGLLAASFSCCFVEYHWQYSWLAIFISGGLLVYYLIKKEEKYFSAASLSFIAWQIVYFNAAAVKRANLYFLIPLTALFFFTYRDKLKKNLCINIFSAILWFHLMLYPYSKVFNDKYDGITTLVIQLFIGVILYLIGMLHSESKKHFADLYKSIGFATAAGCAYLLSFKKMLIQNAGFEHGYFFIVCLALVVAAYLLLIRNLYKHPVRTKIFKMELICLAALFSGSLFILFFPALASANTVIMNTIIFLLAVISIFYGMAIRSSGVFNSGIGIFVLLIITRYVDIFWELTEKSWFFIIAGLFMLIGGAYLEKRRKKVIEKWGAE